MVTPQAKATLNDVGTEELAHLEMIGTICHQLVENATPAEMRAAGMDASYINNGLGIHPHGAEGAAWTGSYIQSKGDPITDLYENMAAEQKARSTYEYAGVIIGTKPQSPRTGEFCRFNPNKT